MKIGRNEKCPCNSGKKLKYCHINWQPSVPFMESEKFIITLDSPKRHSKLFQIRFNNDGSLYVDFPYFKNSNGIASQIVLDTSIKYPTNISLLQNGKITSHLVKYAHHSDGEAHFSQHSKIKTEIRKKATPLCDSDGHIFTVMLQGLDAFDEVENEKDRVGVSGKRHIVKIKTLESQKLEGIKFIGWLHPKKSLKFSLNGEAPNNQEPVIYRKLEDRYLQGLLLSSPYGMDYILYLSFELIPSMNNGKPCLTFIGGFDFPKIASNPNLPTSFLALAYPLENPDALAGQISSMDFIPN